MNNPLEFHSIAYICLYVSDVVESVTFYRDVLGLEPANPVEDPATSSWYSFKTGETVLAIEKGGVKKDGVKTKAENPFILQLKVESLEKLEEMNAWLEENKVMIFDRSKQTRYGIITNFCDPDGNKIELICELK